MIEKVIGFSLMIVALGMLIWLAYSDKYDFESKQ